MDNFMSVLISALLQLSLSSCIPFFCWLGTGRKKEPFFHWIGLKLPHFHGSVFKVSAIVIGSAVMYILAVIFIMKNLMSGVQTATSQFSGKGIIAVPAILVFAIFQTGLSEELFFRGFLCKRLSNRFGFVVGNLVQSLCFGLLHGIPFGIATGKVVVCVLLTLLPAVIGYVQGWLNEKEAGGSIIPSWILHSLMNILSAVSTI